MANREALRELQSRLAERLKTARSTGISVAWLAVRAGEVRYLFPLGQSGEIFPYAGIQSVPYVQNWFRGVINVRGALLGVVDIADFISQDMGGEPAPSRGIEASVVTFNAGLEVNCSLLVDELLGLRGAEDFIFHEPPGNAVPAYFGNRFKDAAGMFWQEINLRSLSQAAQFLNISA